MQEVLPIAGEINTTSVRNNLHSLGQRLEDELGEENVTYIQTESESDIAKQLERIKWCLWHGNVFK